MISIHVVADNAPPERLDRSLRYLKVTKQPYVTVAGGSQIDRAMQFVERCHLEMPTIGIFWRILEDTGNAVKMDNGTWWHERVEPRLKWMQEHKVIFVLDNETSGSDTVIQFYVNKSIDRLARLHDVGLHGATCRFATGNIQDGSQPGQSNQYPLLKPLLQAMDESDWLNPNEYSNTPSKSSGGHLQRYKRITAVMPEKKFNISIGECGILKDYGAREGYTTIPISGETAARDLLESEQFYEDGKYPRFWFTVGGNDDWKNVQVGNDALDFLETYYQYHPINEPTIPQPPPDVPPVVILPPVTPPPATSYKPPPFVTGSRYTITVPDIFVNVRAAADVSAAKVGEIPNKSLVTVYEEKQVGDDYWRRVQFGMIVGWVALQKGAVQYAPYISDVGSVSVPIDLLQHIATTLQEGAQQLRTLSLQIASASDNMQKDYTVVKAILDKIAGQA